ncbi:MAG: hypothetical protein ACRELY_00525 [Polyangiaceae bacterium]
MAGLVHFFRESLDALSGRFGATRRQFPTLIGADVLTRCRYIQTFPHSLTLVTHLREDLSCIQKFSRESRWDGQELAFDHDALASVECLLSSSVCFHHYAWIAGSKLTDGQCVTAVGKCFRFESGNLSGLERLWDFTMHEIIFVGSGEFVTGERQRGIDEVTALLDRWGLAYRICTATDPFFIDGYSTQTAFQSAFELKYEIRADLPYKGPDASLAVGSLNYHQDFFGRSFDIDCASAPAHTGCIAFGLERLALAFVAQYGTDKSRWPTDVARNVP